MDNPETTFTSIDEAESYLRTARKYLDEALRLERIVKRVALCVGDENPTYANIGDIAGPSISIPVDKTFASIITKTRDEKFAEVIYLMRQAIDALNQGVFS